MRAVVDEMRRDGMKVLAVAVRDLDGDTLRPEDEQDLTLLGYLAFFDAPKKSAGPAIARLRALQVPVKVLSGDAREVTGAVCRRLGIPCERVYTGADLEAAGPDDRAALAESGTVFAELTPAQKADILSILKANGHTVGYLGDGMNDLPALRQADVGIAAEGAACTAQGRGPGTAAAQGPERAGGRGAGGPPGVCEHVQVFANHRFLQLWQHRGGGAGQRGAALLPDGVGAAAVAGAAV